MSALLNRSAFLKRSHDLGLIGLIRLVRWVLGWYWTGSQKATFTAAEDVVWLAYEQHGGRHKAGAR